MQGDGDGWAAGPNNTRRWGKYGAAGLLLCTSTGEILLQHRAQWTADGGYWGIPGGARDSHETAIATAQREAYEEAGIPQDAYVVVDDVVTAGPYPGGWTYTTVIATTDTPLKLHPNEESIALEWVPIHALDTYNLMPAFAEAWITLRRRIEIAK